MESLFTTAILFIFAILFIGMRWRYSWGSLWRRRGAGIPRPTPPNQQRGETWGGKRVNAPVNPLPTDPNSIRIPDMFKTPMPAPTSPTPTDTVPAQERDPYAPLDVEDQPQAPAPSNQDDVKRRLAELESYREQGIISDKEYKQMRRDAMRGR